MINTSTEKGNDQKSESVPQFNQPQSKNQYQSFSNDFEMQPVNPTNQYLNANLLNQSDQTHNLDASPSETYQPFSTSMKVSTNQYANATNQYANVPPSTNSNQTSQNQSNPSKRYQAIMKRPSELETSTTIYANTSSVTTSQRNLDIKNAKLNTSSSESRQEMEKTKSETPNNSVIYANSSQIFNQ